jgi:hypothetical protein
MSEIPDWILRDWLICARFQLERGPEDWLVCAPGDVREAWLAKGYVRELPAAGGDGHVRLVSNGQVVGSRLELTALGWAVLREGRGEVG